MEKALCKGTALYKRLLWLLAKEILYGKVSLQRDFFMENALCKGDSHMQQVLCKEISFWKR